MPRGLEAAAWIGAGVALAVYLRFVTNGFWGDDWELLAQAIRGARLTDPISAHLRPMVRAVFLLGHLTLSPTVFHVLSVALHVATSVAVFGLVKRLYGRDAGRLAALLFFAAFPANEAVYWISAIGVVACLLFTVLAVRLWLEDRPLAAGLLLIPAALSYELWLVALPLFFLVRRGRAREWALPAAVFATFAAAYLARFGRGGASAYGGLKWAELPERLATYAYHVVAPIAQSGSIVVSLIVIAVLLAGAVWLPALRFPVALYLGAALILALAESEVMISRFCYVPQLGLVLMIVVLAGTGTPARWAGAALAVYLLAASPVWNVLDGRDYRALGRFYTDAGEGLRAAVAGASAGDAFGFLNRTDPQSLIDLARAMRGRPKTVYVRGTALSGAVFLKDAAALALSPRGLSALPNPACTGKRLELGTGKALDRFCFEVVAR